MSGLTNPRATVQAYKNYAKKAEQAEQAEQAKQTITNAASRGSVTKNESCKCPPGKIVSQVSSETPSSQTLKVTKKVESTPLSTPNGTEAKTQDKQSNSKSKKFKLSFPKLGRKSNQNTTSTSSLTAEQVFTLLLCKYNEYNASKTQNSQTNVQKKPQSNENTTPSQGGAGPQGSSTPTPEKVAVSETVPHQDSQASLQNASQKKPSNSPQGLQTPSQYVSQTTSLQSPQPSERPTNSSLQKPTTNNKQTPQGEEPNTQKEGQVSKSANVTTKDVDVSSIITSSMSLAEKVCACYLLLAVINKFIVVDGVDAFLKSRMKMDVSTDASNVTSKHGVAGCESVDASILKEIKHEQIIIDKNENMSDENLNLYDEVQGELQGFCKYLSQPSTKNTSGNEAPQASKDTKGKESQHNDKPQTVQGNTPNAYKKSPQTVQGNTSREKPNAQNTPPPISDTTPQTPATGGTPRKVNYKGHSYKMHIPPAPAKPYIITKGNKKVSLYNVAIWHIQRHIRTYA